jgi:hypothetical protein
LSVFLSFLRFNRESLSQPAEINDSIFADNQVEIAQDSEVLLREKKANRRVP